MRKAETILNIIRERGQRNLPVKNVYRLLYQRDLYLRAYGKLCRNKGAMTEGVTVETVDGMSLEKIDKIIEGLRYERYRWTPVKRIYVLKKSGKRRPLGLPTWSNKLLQEVIRLILEAYYEPKFSECSHGFRPKRGCHTALRAVMQKGRGTKWFNYPANNVAKNVKLEKSISRKLLCPKTRVPFIYSANNQLTISFNE